MKNPCLILITVFVVAGLSSCSLTQLKPEKNIEYNDQYAIDLTRTDQPKTDIELLSDPECHLSKDQAEQLPDFRQFDVWDRIRNGFSLEHETNKRVQQQLNWYARHPSYMERVAKRGSPYLFHIVEEVESRGLPLEIALLPIVESAFDGFAYSHGRASGIWQIIPGTGKMLGLKQNWWYDGRRDITASTDAALNYLTSLNKRFDGDWLLALAAYNSGAGNVNKAIRANKRKGKPTDFWSLNLPRETKAYVPKLIALAKLVDNPKAHGLSLYPVANKAHFATVDTGSQIDLAQAAELAGIDMETLYKLNPGYNRWATNPNGPHQLLVPVEKAERFTTQINALDDNQRLTWRRYKIRNGDSVSTIATRHKISIETLKNVNQLRSNKIRAGDTLMIPVASKNTRFYSRSVEQRLEKKHQRVASSSKGKKINYVVKAGDSFWSIAKIYKVKPSKIAKWNNMATRDPIRIGQNLAIWTERPLVSDIAGNSVIRKLNYRVKNGDSLYRIADKFSVDVNDILRWNGLNKKKYLQPGQAITLYVDVTKI